MVQVVPKAILLPAARLGVVSRDLLKQATGSQAPFANPTPLAGAAAIDGAIQWPRLRMVIGWHAARVCRQPADLSLNMGDG